jgi:hypothetical protein
MNPKAKAYVEKYVKEKTAEHQLIAKQPGGLIRFGVSSGKRVLAFIGGILEEIGPYYCELRPMRRVQRAVAQCCRRKQAIGYHGLV